MKDELTGTQGLLQTLSDEIHRWAFRAVPEGFILFSQISLKILLLLAVVAIFNFIAWYFLKSFRSLFYNKLKDNAVVAALYQSKVLDSVANFIALFIGRASVQPIFYRHPNSFEVLSRIFAVLMIIAGYVLYHRILTTVDRYFIIKKDFYRMTAMRAVTSSLDIVGIFIFGFIGITVLFGVSASAILGVLGALTAVILLVFRDTILGFVTGIHVSTSRIVKVGDWVIIPKYQIEGNIEDISLLTTKIKNLDRTVSTIPTYDLMSTEIKNFQVMLDNNRRRIKRSIVLNVKSFKFLDEELLSRLSKINLIKDYLSESETILNRERALLDNQEEIINGRQLTNIGVYRHYIYQYLESNPYIDQNLNLMVRQLEVTPTGMPLEIICFTKTSEWKKYETIMADIFDHLLTAAKEFDLVILQVTRINGITEND